MHHRLFSSAVAGTWNCYDILQIASWFRNQDAVEIQRKGSHDISAQALKHTEWLEVVPVSYIPEIIVEWGLGSGESSVLAYAYEHFGIEVVIDDLAGRKCANSLGIPVRGTLGLILIVKKRGIIPTPGRFSKGLSVQVCIFRKRFSIKPWNELGSK